MEFYIDFSRRSAISDSSETLTGISTGNLEVVISNLFHLLCFLPFLFYQLCSVTEEAGRTAAL